MPIKGMLQCTLLGLTLTWNEHVCSKWMKFQPTYWKMTYQGKSWFICLKLLATAQTLLAPLRVVGLEETQGLISLYWDSPRPCRWLGVVGMFSKTCLWSFKSLRLSHWACHVPVTMAQNLSQFHVHHICCSMELAGFCRTVNHSFANDLNFLVVS